MDAEELRYELRRWLCGRPNAAMPATAIVAGLRLWGHEAKADEVEAAAGFLAGLSPAQVTITRAALGSTRHYQITSAGILAHERNE